MKYIRLLLLVLATSLFVAPAVSAQGGGGGGGGMGQGRGRGGAVAVWLQGITLSAEQQTKADTIAAKYRTMRQGLAEMDSTARAAKMTELNGKQADEVRAILTADQQKVFDENRKNNPTGRRGAPPPSL